MDKVRRDDGTETDRVVPLYERVHVMGYSFGSVVAIDSLYPFNQEPPVRFSAVHAFVTIACPFDLIRTYFKEYPGSPTAANPANPPVRPYSYFENRCALPNAPKRWLNIYSLSDVMSSNFRDDERIDAAVASIGLRSQRVGHCRAALSAERSLHRPLQRGDNDILGSVYPLRHPVPLRVLGTG